MSIYKRVATHVSGINDLKNAINYIFDPEKTSDHLIYSRGVAKMSAYEDMRFIKELYCKATGRQYLHWVLSHDKGVPLEIVKAVNLEVLKLIGNEFQVVAATHTNTQNLHTHFVLNSVKVRDGKKFSQSRKEMLQFRQAINEILQAHGLKTIGTTEDFQMSDQIEEVEVSIPDAPKLYKLNNVIWTQGIKPFVIGADSSVGKQGEEETPKLIKPFTIGESRLIKPFTIEEQKLVKPFTFEEEEKS